MGPKHSSSSISKSSSDLFFLFGNTRNTQEVMIFNQGSAGMIQLKPPNSPLLKNSMGVVYVDKDQIYLSGGVNSSTEVISNQVLLYNPISNSFKFVESMKQSRYSHCLTYKKGKLYAIGGRGIGDLPSQFLLSNCEIYDIRKNVWDNMPNLNKPRFQAMSILFQDQIYVFGGLTGELKKSKKIEILNEKDKKWTVLPFKLTYGVSSAIVYPRINKIRGCRKHTLSGSYLKELHALTVNIMIKPRVQASWFVGGVEEVLYIFGGDEEETCEAFSQGQFNLFEPQKTPPMSEKVVIKYQGYSMTHVPYNLDWTPFYKPLIDISSISPNNYLQEGPSPNQQDFYAQSEYVVIFGERSLLKVRLYDFSIENVEYQLDAQQLILHSMGGVRISEGSYLLIGGVNKQMTQISANTLQASLINNKVVFTNWQSMNQVRYAFGVIKCKSEIYVIGGRQYGGDDQGVIPLCEKINLNEGPQAKWERIASLNERRCTPMCFEHKGKVYIAGGYRGHLKREDTIEVYYEDKDIWYLLGLSLPYQMEASYLLNNSFKEDNQINLIFFGGRTQHGDVDKVFGFKIDLDKNLDGLTPSQCLETYPGPLQKKNCLLKGIKISPETVLLFGFSDTLTITEYSLEKKCVINAAKWTTSILYQTLQRSEFVVEKKLSKSLIL